MTENSDNELNNLAQPEPDELVAEAEVVGKNPAELLGLADTHKHLKQQVSTLEVELEKAKIAAEEHKDKVLRALAEVDNIRRKALRDIENARKFALEPFLKELLPVIDSLEHAMQAAHNLEAAMLEGLQLTEKMLLDLLQKFGIEQLSPLGEKFAAEWHEALSAQPTDEAEPNTILAVVQKGYQLNGRLIRPARVIVAKTP